MTRGYKPVVAIGEAKRRAQVRGFVLIAVETDIPLPFDFVIKDGDCISLVRVRRLKYAEYDTADILRLCAQEIVELRQVPVTDEILRELWARGPGRDWHRYLVLKDGIEPLANGNGTQGSGSHEGGSQESGSPEPGSLPKDQGTLQPARQPESTGAPENTGRPELTIVPEKTGLPANTGIPEHIGQLENTGLPENTRLPENSGQLHNTGLSEKTRLP
jgi:hypothetical protein